MAAKLDKTRVDQITARLALLTPETQGKWGRLDAHGMIAHLIAALEMSLEEREVPDVSNWVTRSWPIRMLLIHVVAIPKGKIKAPDSLTPRPEANFEDDRVRLEETLHRFVRLAAEDPNRKTRHLAFGMLTMAQWQLLHRKHVEFHLDQFGL